MFYIAFYAGLTGSKTDTCLLMTVLKHYVNGEYLIKMTGLFLNFTITTEMTR